MDDARLLELVAEVSLNELREDENTRPYVLEQFREWIAKTSDIVYCRTDDSFLLRFLRMRKFSLPMAEQTLVKFIKLRQTFRHLMFDLDIRSQEVDDLISKGFSFVSPHRDEKGRQVVIHKLGMINVQKHSYESVLKAVQLTNAVRMEDEVSQVLGFTYIFDMENLNVGMLTMFPLQELVDFIRAGEQSTPMRHKEFHFVNMPQFLIFIYDTIKGGCSKKLQERFMLHNSLSELPDKIHPKCLPKEYGGSMPMVDMAALWKEEIISKRQIILDLDKIKLRDIENAEYNPNNRNTGISGLQGSFRKIEID